ncbi:MAG: hypothetical protein JKY98_12290 [Gammaproteobacteria bacterium]|nr:hypothetical protein [Gammaproteobacteria bacterium]
MSIVLTPNLVREALPVGSTEQEVKSYLVEIAGTYQFVTRETDPVMVPAYPWQDTDVGYYVAGIEKVRSRWWLPSFGGIMRVRVGISSDGQVTQVDITGARTGFP